MELEFIIALTDHRYLGKVFTPYLIKEAGPFKSVVSVVVSSDIKKYEYSFSETEIALIETIEKYSDEALARKFSRSVNVTEFYDNLKKDYFENHVSPYIDKYLYKCTEILITNNIRLYRKEAKYANLYDEDEITLNRSFAEAFFSFERGSEEIKYKLRIVQEGKQLGLSNRKIEIVAQEPCILNYRNNLLVFRNLNAKRLTPFFTKDYVSVPISMEEKYFKTFVLNTIREYEVEAIGFSIVENPLEKRAVLSLENNLKSEPVLVLRYYYGETEFLPNSIRKVSVAYQNNNGEITFIRTSRDRVWEAHVESFLEKQKLIDHNGFYLPAGFEMLEKQNALFNLVNWINRNSDKLIKERIEVIQQKLEKKYFTGNQELKLKLVGVSDWFDIFATVRFGEYEIPFIKLKKYILNDIREFELPNGEFAILPDDWFSEYKELLPFSQPDGKKLRVSKHHFQLIKKAVKEFDRDMIWKIEKLDGKEKLETELPATLKATLRPYQFEGFNWLYSLYVNSFGGCLADDMGLGKTLQALAVLLKTKRLKGKIHIPEVNEKNGQMSLFDDGSKEKVQLASLIVLPTSLVHNWENEIRKFAPSLKVYTYTGIQRRTAVNLKEASRFYDVILTTYGTVRNDVDILADLDFFYLILDESQYIKNPTSKIYKAVLKLRSAHRLVLTGTPIENSLMDLWAQMNFLNRGMLGNKAYFKRFFITPIEKKNDPDVNEKLQLLIRPFILRRKKEEVAGDLPPLMEQVRYCTMEKNQQKIYEREKSAIRNTILENIEKEGVEKSSMVVLQGLTKLRQLANHPSMLENYEEADSGKFNEIFNALDDLMAENHKVLIFSSFVKHLNILKVGIEKRGWDFSMLTGQTQKRSEVIKSFQQNEATRIFLISLKAGGVGLNLVEADYVFIIDPWWNPASELQAINRAHRIGQDKHVFVYRFITENSIEQKIQQLQARKSILADRFINSNNPFKEFTREEITNLLK